MPRVMVFGKSKHKTKKVAHIVRAFQEQGNETLWLNPAQIQRRKGEKTDRYILERIERFNPDIVFIHSMDLPLPVLEKIAHTHMRTVQYFHDCWRLELLPKVAQWGRLVDIFLENAKGLHDQFRAAGIKDPVFIVEGCDTHDHRKRHPLLPIWKSDVAFVGAARQDEERISLIRHLSQVSRVRVYGKDWKKYGIKPTMEEVGPRGYGLICGGAKIVLGVDAVTTIEGHWTNRLWLTLGCGGFHLTNYVAGMEEIFTNRKHLVWFQGEEECVSLVQEYLSKPEERKKIAEEGYRLVHEQYTFHHFVDKVLALCKNYSSGEKEK